MIIGGNWRNKNSIQSFQTNLKDCIINFMHNKMAKNWRTIMAFNGDQKWRRLAKIKIYTRITKTIKTTIRIIIICKRYI